MAGVVRTAVSRKKRRYQKDGFDLDLAYITDRIIAMGFPSEGAEGVYRNPMKEVQKFLEVKHGTNYKVYNLCSERGYDPSKFDGRCAVYPFEDHNAPPFEMIEQFCQVPSFYFDDRMHKPFLLKMNATLLWCTAKLEREEPDSSPAVTSCTPKSGIYLSEIRTSAVDAMQFYAAMRTYNKKGQIRYVHYYSRFLYQNNREYEPRPLLLNEIRLTPPPYHSHIADLSFKIFVGKTLIAKDSTDLSKQLKELKKSGTKINESSSLILKDEFKNPVPLCGDVKFDFMAKGDKLFQFWINTAFIDNERLVVPKEELDKAWKDTNHKLFSKDFQVELRFTDITGTWQKNRAGTLKRSYSNTVSGPATLQLEEPENEKFPTASPLGFNVATMSPILQETLAQFPSLSTL